MTHGWRLLANMVPFFLEGCGDSDRMTWMLESTHGCRRNAGEHGQGTCTYMSRRQGWEFPFHQVMVMPWMALRPRQSIAFARCSFALSVLALLMQAPGNSKTAQLKHLNRRALFMLLGGLAYQYQLS